MNTPLVYVLVINWNGLEHLRECFDSLLAGTYPNARFLLIDNASSDGSVEFVKETYGERVEILSLPSNLGWSGGNNAGIEHALAADADYVFLLNNDTWTAPDAIERLVAMAEERPEIGALAPKMLMFDSPDILNSVGLECSIIGSSWDLGIGRLDGPRWSTPQPVIGVCGGAALFRAEALRKTGLLPTDFEIYLDDLDLALRVWNAGYEVWSCPEARVRHKFGATMQQGKRYRHKYFLNTRNRLYLMLRNFPMSRAIPVTVAFKLGEFRAIGRAALDREFWRIGAHARAWMAGIAYLPEAWRERRRRRRSGQAACRFWHLVRKDRMFFQGVEFPVDGWYAEREIRGTRARPIASRATMRVDAGRLRVTHMNCYPALGSTSVEVVADGQCLAVLETKDIQVTEIQAPGGVLEFRASRIFDAESTGLLVDVGGWLRVERE